MKNVLIVEDDKLVRMGLISAVPWERFGMRIAGEAKNGAKALEFLEAEPVDLIVTDLAMPVMSGIELMRCVRERYPDIPFVVLTMHQDFEYIQEALRLGAIDYIAKVELEQDNFDTILARIHSRMEERTGSLPPGKQAGKSLFYDCDPELQAVAVRVNETFESPDAGSDEKISQMRSKWTSPEWIYSEPLFQQLTEELKRIRLPQPKLLGLLYSLADEWNRLYSSVGAAALPLPERLDFWFEAEEWLKQSRELIERIHVKQPYSQEVVGCVMKAASIVREELDRPLTAGETARRVNMSRSYFSLCFKDITGHTFNEYLRQARLAKAKELLLFSNRTVAWIAEHTGYQDEKYFSRLFREQIGMLPSEFRTAGRGQQQI